MQTRTPLVDTLKMIAAQLIVLHHLAFYGPLSDVVHAHLPALVEWLYDYARMVVQVFLVLGGYLTARSFNANKAPDARGALRQLMRRYQRLVLPYLGALLLAIAGAAIARNLMQHDSIPTAPSLPQLLSHLVLLQGLLEYEALSAGVWYIAIDFQLFALMLGCAWSARAIGGMQVQRRAHAMYALVCLLALASLLHFNRLPHWDDWGVYFFGAYALGALAWWAGSARSALWMLVPLALGLLALLIEARLRLGLALCTALALAAAQRAGSPQNGFMQSHPIRLLAESSYSTFLLHFPVCLVINALFHRLAPGQLWPSIAGLLLAWLFSNLAGITYHSHVERPLQRRLIHGTAS